MDSDRKITGIKKNKKNQLINSNNDIVKAINEVCRWLEENEPSSPVLLLAEYARNLVGKRFMETSEELKKLFKELNKTIRLVNSSNVSGNRVTVNNVSRPNNNKLIKKICH